MRPGHTSTSYPCGSPLPLPSFTSGGFWVNGLSGNTRIQSLPVLPKFRAITLRALSSWLLRTRAWVVALSPWLPKATVTPRVATFPFLGLRRMVCHFLNFTFLGNSIHFLFNRASHLFVFLV